jgi:hypothetical protein
MVESQGVQSSQDRRHKHSDALCDSNSTRTESSVVIGPENELQEAPREPKATGHNRYRLISRPSLEKEAGLQSLCVSAFVVAALK